MRKRYMTRYYSLKKATHNHPELKLGNINLKLLQDMNLSVVIDVCEHKHVENWDCYCTYGCETCHIHSKCKDCGQNNPKEPIGYILDSQVELISTAINELKEKLYSITQGEKE